MLRERRRPSAGAAGLTAEPVSPRDVPASELPRLEAPVLEIFGSIQGEGLYVGEPQVFVRLAGCPLRCTYCDTPGSWPVPEHDGRSSAAWFDAAGVRASVESLESGSPRTVSLTGGEPLLWPDFAVQLARELRPRRLHLETAGAHPRALAQVLEFVDHVSLDLKLPEDLRAPVVSARADDEHERVPVDADDWARARVETLELVRERDACAKLVLCGGTAPERYDPLLEDLRRIAPRVPVILQPATPMGAVRAPEPDEVLDLTNRILGLGLTVRVLPQVHRQLRLP